MTASDSPRSTFRNWLRTKRGFYLYNFATVGVGSWLILIWNFGHAGGYFWIAWLGILALVGAFFSGWAFWHLFLVKRRS